jgi:hypothetical protein
MAGQPAVVASTRFAGLSLGYFSLRCEIEAPGAPRRAEPGPLEVESCHSFPGDRGVPGAAISPNSAAAIRESDRVQHVPPIDPSCDRCDGQRQISDLAVRLRVLGTVNTRVVTERAFTSQLA